MTNGTFDPVLNCDSSPVAASDWNFQSAIDAGLVSTGQAPPSQHDLRDQPGWKAIGNQGLNGACVGWAVADAMTYHFVQNGKLQADEHVSARYIWMASKEMDEEVDVPTTFLEQAGTTIKSALHIAMKFGAVTDDVMPFDVLELPDMRVSKFYVQADALRIIRPINLGIEPDHWRLWISQRGPIVARVLVDKNFREADKNKSKLTATRGALSEGHACLIVGYGARGFIIRNSWGTDWGDEGFAHASDNYINAAFVEAFGIVV